MPFSRSFRVFLSCGAATALTALGGCAGIPASGPTAGQVVRGTRPEQNTLGMQLVDVDHAVVAQTAADDAAADKRVATLATLAQSGQNDVVGVGDILSINIYEVGVGLFSGGQSSALGQSDPTSRGEAFPAIVIDRNGDITLPYTGVLHVAGHTPLEIQEMINRAYRGKSQSPQALVIVRQNMSQTAYVTGDVRKSGRVDLTLRNERLLDAVADAGGAVSQTQDMVVRFVRGNRAIEERLDRIQAGAPDDLVLVAGDHIELIREPQTFVVLGAAGRASQIGFDQTDLTLAEAIARAGGPNDATANPRSVFLFRYKPSLDPSQPAKPVIYRINLMEPANYFLAQKFAMRNKDVLFVSNAAINRTAKFVAIINQMFSPFVTAAAVSTYAR